MKKLLFAITLAETGGAQNHVLDLIRAFRVGLNVALVVGEDGYLAEQARSLGVPVYIIKALRRQISPFEDLRAIGEMRAIIRNFQPDIVHAHSTKAGLVARIAGKAERVPVIFTAHGWVFAPGVPLSTRFLVWLIEALIAPLSAHIICVSKYDYSLALKYLPVSKRKVTVVHNGITSKASQATLEGGLPTLIMTARFQPQKDHSTLIRALTHLPHRNFRVILAGDGPLLEENKRLVEQLGLKEQVEFLGNRSDIELLLAKSHIFVLFSNYEGLPISIIEAMRAGLPVIATDVCGVSEEVEHGVTGFLVPRNDVVTAALMLEHLIADKQLRQTMGTNARRKFLSEFTTQSMIENLKRVYARLLSSESVSV